MKRTIIIRLQEKFTANSPDGCWPWNAYKNRDGYGGINFDGKHRRAHVVMWTVCFGAPNRGLCVCHTCDNPSCVNPHHLFLGTHEQNIADMTRKGRAARRTGAAHPTVKLTTADVLEIRNSRKGQKELASVYGVTRENIHAILMRRTWTHI